MIKVEKTKEGFKIVAKGGSGDQFTYELLEASSSIYAEILQDDMTEAETDEFFKWYIDNLRRMTKEKKEKIARKDPSLRTEVKKHMKMPWE